MSGAARKGFVSLVGAGPRAPDLITVRGMERLSAAEVVLHDRLVDPALLEHAPPGAERVLVGKRPGGASWRQEDINALVCARARAGYRVVRLKCGDPGIFGRVSEEMQALEAEGISYEIVPGVTAASAAAAAVSGSLTERGACDTLVVSTGRLRDGAEDPDWAHHLRPGARLVLYMGVGRAGALQRALTARGQPAESLVTIVESASQARERVHVVALGALAAEIAARGISNPAIIMLDAANPAVAAARPVLVAAE